MSIAHTNIRLITLVAILAAAGAQAAAEVPEPAPTAADTTVSPAEPVTSAPLRLWFQSGMGYRLDDRPSYDPDADKVMLTWEIAAFRWDGHSTAWGLGVRSAKDDLGFRLGPKALVRRPLGGGGKAYYQFAATYYLFAGDSDLADRPGWALEAEIAPVTALVFVLGLELMQYNVQDDATDDPAWFTDSITSTYFGVKLNQWWGIAVTAALFAMAGLYATGT